MPRPLPQRVAALVAAAFVLFAGLTCTDATAPTSKRLVPLSLAPVFTQAATDVYRNLLSLQLDIDNIHVVLKHSDGSTALDTVVARPAGQDSIVLILPVELKGNTEELTATIELRLGQQVLFSGTQTVHAQVGLTSPPTTPIEIEYTGPGATVVTLDVNPDTTISGIDDIQMRVIGRDANNQVVPNMILGWTVAGTNVSTVATITQGGLLQPTGNRGTVTVTAELPTGLTASATVVIDPPPSGVVLISGGGQTGTVGSALAAPIVVEVQATDGGPVAGHAVTFAVTAGGGSVAPTNAVTGANGRASVTLTLGNAPGTNTVQVTAANLTPINVSATANVGPPARLAMVQQPSANAISGTTFAQQPSVRVQDALGNNLAAANIPVTVALTAADGRTLQGTATQNTSAAGVAQFTGLAISGPPGTTTLTFASGSLTTAISSSISVSVGAPSTLNQLNVLTSSDTAGANVAPQVRPAVIVRDATNNGVSGVEVKFRRHGGAGATINGQPDTIVIVMTDAGGAAFLSARRLQTLAGFDTVLVTAAGLNDTLRFVATVTHASATHLAFVQQPVAGVAGSPFTPAPSVEVRDQFLNRVTTGPAATATVTMAISVGSLTGTPSVAAVAGLATFSNLVSPAPGTGLQLMASASGVANATSNAFSVTTGAPASLSATSELLMADTAGANVASVLLPAVIVRDASNNPVEGVEIKFRRHGGVGSSINSPQPDTMVLVNTAANGTAALTQRTLQMIVGFDTVLVTAAGLNDTLAFVASVTHANALTIAFVQQPTGGIAGVALTPAPSVEIRDQYGNRVTTGVRATATVLMDLQGNTTSVDAIAGLATFTNLVVAAPASGLQLFANVIGLNFTSSNVFSVTSGAPASLSATSELLMADTAGANVASVLVPAVIVRDASNNPVEGVEIKFRRHGGVGSSINSQPDTMVLVNTAANGTAALSARRLQTLVGFDTVLVTAAGLNDTLRFAASVSHASATNLAYVQQPLGGVVLTTMVPAPSVEVRDQFGNRVTTGASATATINVNMGLVDALLGGTTTRAAVAGLATFDDLTLTPAGTYQILAVSSGLTGATSNLFTINSASASTRVWLTAAGGNWEDAVNWSGNVVPGAADTALINLSGSYNVFLSTPRSIGKIVIGGETGAAVLAVSSGGSLTVGDSIRVVEAGALLLASPGTVLTGGTILIQGIGQWVEGNIASGSPIHITPGGLFQISAATTMTLSGRTIINEGSLHFVSTAPGNLTLESGAAIDNQVEAEFLIQGDGDIVAGATAPGTITNVGGFVRRLIGDAGVTTIGVPFVNSAIMEIQAGTLAFTATLTNGLNATIQGLGTLDVSGATSFQNAGRVAPGLSSPGVLTVTGDLAMQGVSRLEIELGGTTPGTEYDVLTVTGTANLSGTLAITNVGLNPQDGQVFTVLNYQSRSGTFASITGLDLGNGFTLVPEYLPTSVTLTVDGPAAPTISWTNPDGGSWITPSNWSTGVLPASTDVVRIDLPGTYTVTLGVDASIAGLVVGGGTGAQSLVVGSGRTLAVNGNSSITANGTLDLTGASLVGSGTVTNQGTVILTGSFVGATTTLSNQGVLVAQGASTIGGPVSTTSASEIEVLGNVTGGNAILSIAQGFTNNGLIELTSTSALAAQLTVINGTLVNATTATIRSAFGQDGGSRILAAQLDNRGTLDAEEALTLNQPSAQHLNSGAIDLTGANLTVTQTGTTPSFANTGMITIGPGRAFTATGGVVTNASAGIISGSGTLDVAGTAFTNEGIVAPNGQGVVGVLAVTGSYTHGATGTLNIELAGTSQYDILSISGAASLGGALNVSLIGGFQPGDGNSFTILNYQSQSGSFVTVNLPALGAGLEWVTTVGASSLTLTVQTSSAQTISWANANGGDWSLASNWSGGVVPTSADNVVIDLAGTYTVTLDVDPIIAGLFLGGASGTQTLTGTGRTLTVTGATNIASTGVLTLVSSSNLGGTGTVTNLGSLTLRSSTVAATTTLFNRNVLILRGSTAINGPFQTDAGSIITVEAHPIEGPAAINVANGFTNSGQIDMISTSGHLVTLTVQSGSLFNAPGAFIVSLPGAGGTHVLAAALDNAGTLQVQYPLEISRADAIHQNTGTIDVSSSLTLTQTGASPAFANTNSIVLGDDATFTVNGGTVNLLGGGSVTGNNNSSLLAVTGSATLNFTPAELSVPLSIAPTVTVAGGSIAIGGDQQLRLINSTVSVPVTVGSDGTLWTLGTVDLTTLIMPAASSVLRVRAQNNGGPALTTVANGFTNNGTIELNSTINHPVSLTVNGTLNNSVDGVIVSNVGEGGGRTLTAQLNNQGVLNVSHPLTINRANAAHVNTGFIDVSANLGLTGIASLTNNGNIQLSGAGTVMTVSGGTFTNGGGDPPGVIVGAGTLDVNGTTFTNHGVVQPTGVLTVSGIYTQSVSGTLQPWISSTTAFGQLQVSGTATLAGTLAPHVNDFLPPHDQDFVVVATSSPIVGSLTPASLTFPTGQFTVSTNSTQIILTTVLDGFPNITWTGGTGSWNTPGNWSLNRVPISTDVVGIDQAGTYTVMLDASPTIAGLFLGGTSGTQTLTSTTQTLTVNGPTNIAAAGSLQLTGSTVNSTGAVNNLGAMQLTNTTFNSTGTVTNVGSMVLESSGFGASTAVSNQGSMLIRGTLAGPGLLNTQPSSIITIEGGSFGTGNLNMTNSFSNAGIIELTSANGNSSMLTVAGPFINGPTGTIRAQPGGGDRTLAVVLDNQGTIESNYVLTINRADAQHVNTGVMDAGTGLISVVQTGPSATFTNNGIISIPENQSFQVNGGTFTNSGTAPVGSVQGEGGIQFTNVTVNQDGRVAPTGIFGWTGGYAPSANAVLDVQLRNGVSDRLLVTGTATVNGTLNVTLAPDLIPLTQYTIVIGTTLSGIFSTINLPPGWTVNYATANEVKVSPP